VLPFEQAVQCTCGSEFFEPVERTDKKQPKRCPAASCSEDSLVARQEEVQSLGEAIADESAVVVGRYEQRCLVGVVV
jgi:hypothetical protein